MEWQHSTITDIEATYRFFSHFCILGPLVWKWVVAILQINMKLIFALKMCKKKFMYTNVYYTVQCIWFLLPNKSEFEWFNEFMMVMTMGNLTPLSVFSFIGRRKLVYSINIYSLYIMYMSWQTYMWHNIRFIPTTSFQRHNASFMYYSLYITLILYQLMSTITSKRCTCTSACQLNFLKTKRYKKKCTWTSIFFST